MKQTAQQRKAARRKNTIEEMRLKLRGDWYVREVHAVLDLCREDNPDKPETPAALGRAKLRLDAATKMLAKLLPDIKAVAVAELSADQHAQGRGLLGAIAASFGNSPLDHVVTMPVKHAPAALEHDTAASLPGETMDSRPAAAIQQTQQTAAPTVPVTSAADHSTTAADAAAVLPAAVTQKGAESLTTHASHATLKTGTNTYIDRAIDKLEDNTEPKRVMNQ